MNKYRNTLILFIIFSFLNMHALHAGTEPFEKALPGYRFSFPKDHGSHPAYLIEWWYFTGTFESDEGSAFGYELTFFRRGMKNDFSDKNPSRWVVRDIYLAHFALTDISGQSFYYDEKISREAIGKAGAKENQMEVWIDRWQAKQEGGKIHLIAGGGSYKIELTLNPDKQLVIHGEEGISKKGEERGAASHYYSYTRLSTQGKLTRDGKEESISGLSWMDHEFGSSLLGEDQEGWDWFSIQLDDGSEYMFYQIRKKDGKKDAVSSGTVVLQDGRSRHLLSEDFSLEAVSYWKSKKSGANYPVGWLISVPSEGLILTSEPLVNDQELITSGSTRVTYWEGASRFTGQKGDKEITGKGYIELTGYTDRK